MQNCKLGDIPIVKGAKLNKYQCPQNKVEREEMNDRPFGSALGSLINAQVCTRPNIAFIVAVLGRYQSNPGNDQQMDANKVTRYLQRTKEYMLIYMACVFDHLQIVEYTNSCGVL